MSWSRERGPDGRGWESRWWAAQPWEAHAVPWDPHGEAREGHPEQPEVESATISAFPAPREVRAAS